MLCVVTTYPGLGGDNGSRIAPPRGVICFTAGFRPNDLRMPQCDLGAHWTLIMHLRADTATFGAGTAAAWQETQLKHERLSPPPLEGGIHPSVHEPVDLHIERLTSRWGALETVAADARRLGGSDG
jgi:hypothetical protein